jgi:lipopolysaccharide exporter
MTRIIQFLRLEYIRHFLTLFSGSVLGQLLTLALAPVLSRMYTPEDFGLAALYLSILSVLGVLATCKYEQAVMLPRDNNAAIHLFRLVLLLAAIASVITMAVLVLFNQSISAMLGNPLIHIWLFFLPLSLVIHATMQAAVFYSNRTKKFRRIAKTTIVQHVSTNGLKVGAGAMQTGMNGLIAGQIAGHFLAMLFVVVNTMKQIRKTHIPFSFIEIRKQAKIYAQYPRFNMLLSLTNNISGSLPIFLFTRGFSPEAAGLYAFGYAFVFRPVSLFSQSTQQVLSQKMIENHHHGKTIYPTLKKLISRLLLAGLIPFTLVTIWAPNIFAFVFSEAYGPAGQYLQILSPWLFMVFLTSPLTFLHELYFKQKTAMFIDIVYLVLRFMALMTGIWLKDINIALILFSASGTLVVGYKLLWYLQLSRKEDKKVR